MNKPVYRKSEQLSEFFKILATDEMISIQLQGNQIIVTTSRDPISVSAAFDEELTQESNQEEFDHAFYKSYGQMILMNPLDLEYEKQKQI